MSRTGIFLTVGLAPILIGIAVFYPSSSEDANTSVFQTSENDPPVTDIIDSDITDTVNVPERSAEPSGSEAVPFSELPDDVKWVIENDTKPLSEKITGIVSSSQDSSAEQKKHLEEIGLGEEYKYLRNHIDDYSAFYNADVMGEGEAQKKNVRNALRENLAIFMTSRGLNQARVEKLESIDYNVVEGGERAILFQGDAKDFIALSEDAKFVLDDSGTECLIFTSSNLKRFGEKVYGSGSENAFSPYCAYGNNYEPTGISTGPKQTYEKNELEDLIEKFNN